MTTVDRVILPKDTVLAAVCSVYKIQLAKLLAAGKEVREARMAAAVSLSELWTERDWGRIEEVLSCSRSFVREAVQLARSTDPVGNLLRRNLESIRSLTLRPSREPPPARKAKLNELELQREVVRLANAIFVGTGATGNELRRRQGFANMAAALILREAQRSSNDEIASVLMLQANTVSRLLRDARDEYVARGSFFREIGNICDECGIAAPR